jgi:hypothetical protein
MRSITDLRGNLVDKFESLCEVLRSDSRGSPQVWHDYDDDGGGVSVKDLSSIMQVTTRPDPPPQRPLRCERGPIARVSSLRLAQHMLEEGAIMIAPNGQVC